MTRSFERGTAAEAAAVAIEWAQAHRLKVMGVSIVPSGDRWIATLSYVEPPEPPRAA
jgi:hypothetical protein